MIEVEGLTKVYSVQPALRNVSLVVPPGTILAVLGANGSGKTTLLRILATLARPTRGRGRIGGCDLVAERDAVRSLVGLVGHGSQLYDDLTAAENLAFTAGLAGLALDRPALLARLAGVGLEAQADTRARALSSGMRRRLSLARVRLRQPRVLLLDEPFAGLDQESAKRLGDDLHAFRAGGGTAVVVTHSLGRALAVADRLAILAGGRLAALESCAALTEQSLRDLYNAAAEAGT